MVLTLSLLWQCTGRFLSESLWQRFIQSFLLACSLIAAGFEFYFLRDWVELDSCGFAYRSSIMVRTSKWCQWKVNKSFIFVSLRFSLAITLTQTSHVQAGSLILQAANRQPYLYNRECDLDFHPSFFSTVCLSVSRSRPCHKRPLTFHGVGPPIRGES